MVDILTALILLFDFVISIWNAYASGYNIGMLKKQGQQGGIYLYGSYAGLGLAFAGAAYVLAVVFSYIAYILGYVSVATVNIVLSFDFLVFGLMIIGFGLVVAIESIVIAIKKKNIMSVIVALFNVFVEILDIASYIEGFKEASQMIGGGNSRDKGNAAVILIIAVLFAFFIVHAAYRHGYNKAMQGAWMQTGAYTSQ